MKKKKRIFLIEAENSVVVSRKGKLEGRGRGELWFHGSSLRQDEKVLEMGSTPIQIHLTLLMAHLKMIFFSFLVFLRLHPQHRHMEVPRLGGESEL